MGIKSADIRIVSKMTPLEMRKELAAYRILGARLVNAHRKARYTQAKTIDAQTWDELIHDFEYLVDNPYQASKVIH